eukprot:scaffold25766_cov58-Phaeocystis_antarctica.AAC.3
MGIGGRDAAKVPAGYGKACFRKQPAVALIAWWRPGGSTCLSAAAVAVQGRTGSAGAGATQPRRSRRGGAGGGGAGRARGDRRGTLRRDFSKGLCAGTGLVGCAGAG